MENVRNLHAESWTTTAYYFKHELITLAGKRKILRTCLVV